MLDLNPILDAARQAAALTAGFDRVNKDQDGDPVTVADYGAQAILCRALARAYPDHGVLAEEGGDQFATLLNETQRAFVARLVGEIIGETVGIDQVSAWLDHGRAAALNGGSETTWIIDPIDGTKGFVAGRQYAIAIAALADGDPIASVIACPGYGDGLLFSAQGSIAHVQNIDGRRKAARIAVSDVRAFGAARIVGSLERHKGDHPGIDGVYDALGIRRANVQPVDSQAKYAMVACGDADIFMRLMAAGGHKHYVWDHAPGVALVRAAGGVATDMDGSPLRFAPRDGSSATMMPNRGMVVTNGHVHDKLLAAIQPLLTD
jgi:3'(2'), 5'-bisphosphate nucleotidase